MDSEMNGRRTLVAGLLACAFVVAFVAPAGTATQADVLVEDVSVSGDAVAARSDGTVYLWQSRPYALTVTVGQIATPTEYRICAMTDAAELHCTNTTLRPVTAEVELPVSKSAALGGQNVSVTMQEVGTNETIVAGQLARIHVLQPTADFDDDGLRNRAERAAGTNPTRADTDGDLLPDGTEATFGTDPTNRGTVVVLCAAGILLAAAVIAAFSRYEPQLLAPLRRASSHLRSTPTGESKSDGGVERRGAPTARQRAGGSDAATGTGATSASGGQSSSDSSPPLSDEERVIQLLEDEDGQLRQSEIVSRTPWSKSKVSRLLARMDDQRQIVKINAGRQNVIVLPGEEPTELKSPRDRDDD